MDLDRILEFHQLLLQLQGVERALKVPGQDRFENDTEHSYNLALTGWYLASSARLGLDLDRIIKYGLIHDLAEAYAGDTIALGSQETRRHTKQAREQLALMLLRREWPEFSDLHALLEAYEKRQDEESKFIYALDKLMANITVYSNEGDDWRRLGTNLSDGIDYAKPKVWQSEPVARLWEELIDRFKADPDRFPS